MFRSTRRLISTVAAELAIGALAAPAANAVTGEEFRAAPAVQSTESSSPAPTVTRTTADEGFDLGSAAIGAGSAAAVLLLGGAGATMVARRRRVRPAG
jgi:hypothetical protein